MTKKVTYKIQNWKTYNQSLIERGNITLWISKDAINNWFDCSLNKGRGRPKTYSDDCILLALILRTRYSLPLRAVQGFLMGLISLMGLSLPIPNYSRFSRRAKSLNVDYKLQKKKGAIDVVIDSTGLKVYGEGEWKVKIHGKDKRRTWRKLHLAVDPKTFQIVAMELTESNRSDGKILPKLVDKISKIKNAYADAAYMYKECFEAIDSKSGRALIDLRSGTSLAKNPSPGLLQRNKIVQEIWDYGGNKKTWKVQSGYHKRSLVETQMSRLKKILRGSLSSRRMANQVTEAKVMALVLNQMTSLGMPKTKTIIKI